MVDKLCVYISVHFTLPFCWLHFFSPFEWPFLQVDLKAGTITSPFWILLELRVMEVVVTTGAIRRAKLQSNHDHQQTNMQLVYRQDALPVANQQCNAKAMKGNLAEFLRK